MSNKAELKVNDKVYELPIIEGSEGEKAVDISKLRAESGLITLDVGFKNTGSTKSAITFLNGEEGILKHRGYTIEDLAANSEFLEVAYLIINGKLPNKEEYEKYKKAQTVYFDDFKR